MEQIHLYAIAAGGLCAVTAIFWLIYSNVRSNKKVAELKKQLQGSLAEDLELATSEQLMSELRRRPSHPYILLMPIKSETHQGLTVEVHGLPPQMSLAVLRMATMVTAKELKDRGVEIPDMDMGVPPDFPGDIFNDN